MDDVQNSTTIINKYIFQSFIKFIPNLENING